MKAHVKLVYSSDVDVDTYVPQNPENDGQWVRFMVGQTDAPHFEAFDVLLCTTAWLADRVASEGPQIGRHHVIFNSLDLPAAIEFVRRAIEKLERDDWPTLSDRVGWIGMATEDAREYLD